jgi:hypothetical protein
VDLVAQRLSRRLAIQVGEWMLDQTAGLPFSVWARTKPPPLVEVRAIVRREIANCPGIRAVLSVEAVYSNTEFSITVTGRAILEDDTELGISADLGRGNRAPIVHVQGRPGIVL